jgi:hypothetical protein
VVVIIQCAAAAPTEFGWLMYCDRPATALHRYACEHEHVVDRATCDEHAPEPGAVGCRQCFDAGHECDMAAQLLEAIA